MTQWVEVPREGLDIVADPPGDTSGLKVFAPVDPEMVTVNVQPSEDWVEIWSADE